MEDPLRNERCYQVLDAPGVRASSVSILRANAGRSPAEERRCLLHPSMQTPAA